MRKFITILSLSAMALTGMAQTATGLRTDLVEKTDVVYDHGFPASVTLQGARAVRTDLQYAAIAKEHPSFSWRMESALPGTLQAACQVQVATSEKALEDGSADVWDSGMLETDSPVLECGAALSPSAIYYWRVRLWDNHGNAGAWSAAKAFATAPVLDGTFPRTPIVKTLQTASEMVRHEDGTIFLDYGRDAFAQLSLTLTSRDSRTIRVHFGEMCDGSRVERRPGASIRYCSQEIRLMPGTHTYRVQFAPDARNAAVKPPKSDALAVLVPEYIGEVYPFRYVEIEGFEGHVASSDIVREAVTYIFDDNASYFHCDDNILNQVWDLCRYSIKATSFLGVYIDGDRERIPYEADAIINQLGHYCTDSEYAMGRYSVDYLMHQATWPTEWLLQAAIMAWNDYLYTGDRGLIEKDYEVIKARTLSALRETNGLISTRTGKLTKELALQCGYYGNTIRDIVDWPQGGAAGLDKEEAGEADGFVFTDYNTVVNAFHYESLVLVAKMAEVLGHTEDAASYARDAAAVKTAFNSLLFDAKAGCYRDGIGTDHHSLHSNMFALAFGLVPERHRNSVLDFIRSRGMACSVYGSQFLLDAVYEAGDGDYALSLLNSQTRRGWYNMIRSGSTITLEAWDKVFKPNLDWNHAWGAAPADIIPRRLMGVEPAEPGFRRIRIRPQLGSLSEAEAVVPTVRGSVGCHVYAARDSYAVTVEIPANTIAEVWLPCSGRKYQLIVDGIPVKGLKEGGAVHCDVCSGRHQIIVKY